jgi:hypothetical protein
MKIFYRFDMVVDQLVGALSVIVLDKKISAWLKQNDPQALKQAKTALKMIGRRVSDKNKNQKKEG